MQSRLVALAFAALAMTLGAAPANAEKVRCTAIRDSAMCAAEPHCWYDAANGKGCLDGPAPARDGCAVHGSEAICNTSTLGCTWVAAESKCASKAD